MRDTPYKFSAAATAAATESRRKLLFGKYELGDLLGCGAFAKVYHARDLRTGESVAVKAVSKRHVHESNMAAQVKLEVSIMRRLRHPHIIRLLEVLATKTRIYFVMEYAKGGELFAKVAKGGRFSENLSRRYFHQLISAVGYCHSHGVYHRDLKPGNLLLDENWTLKIADFGLSAVSGQSRPDGMLHTLCGTPAYVAPEILNKKGYDGAKVDIWSCGITLYVLSTGHLPFDDSNLFHLYKKIQKGEFRCPRWMSSELKRFLSRLLDTNPKTRITIDEIYDDPWFNKGLYQSEGTVKFNGIKDNGEDIRDNPSQYLNAFDLISFSPGFNLSGLFEEKEEEEEILERFLSAEEPNKILKKIEEEARGINAPQKVKVERTKGDMGLRVEGQNGKFGLVMEVYRLTEKLVVVEVRKREKDVGPGHGFWEHKLRPRICHLFYQSCSD